MMVSKEISVVLMVGVMATHEIHGVCKGMSIVRNNRIVRLPVGSVQGRRTCPLSFGVALRSSGHIDTQPSAQGPPTACTRYCITYCTYSIHCPGYGRYSASH